MGLINSSTVRRNGNLFSATVQTAREKDSVRLGGKLSPSPSRVEYLRSVAELIGADIDGIDPGISLCDAAGILDECEAY